jgi:GT2 family glycosyltransferase
VKTSRAPTVSVIVVVWNRAELTLACLRSLTEQIAVPIEVIVVDNASTDVTAELLSRIEGPTIVANGSNLGFTVAANLGAQRARGEFLLFLNNDAQVEPGCIAQLVETARRTDSIGAVGGKLVFPDGRLQEAGSIIWSDGSCAAYGRGADPASPEYNFERQVDFCSGALLLTPRSVFERAGGFDERYRPAYYEDADYCATLWTEGWPVIYQPKAVAVHHAFGSAGSMDAGVALQRERRPIFVGRHRRWLNTQRPPTESTLVARSHPHGQPAVIVIDDALPHQRMGSGFPRAAALLRALSELGFLITTYTTCGERPSSESRDRFPAVEAIPGSPDGMRAFLASRSGANRSHVAVIVSRPHNMRYVKAAMGTNLANLSVPCIYDAEAIYALRDIGRRNLARQPLPDDAADSSPGQSLIDAEVSLTRGCAAVITVSESERKLFSTSGIPDIFVVGHAVQPDPTPRAFQSRQTMLFVGAFGPESPNEDAARYLCCDILPALRATGCHARLVVAGTHLPDHLRGAANQTVSWHSDVGDLTPFYDEARVFVAPTRYAAGIPLKLIEAAARGVPIVCAPRLAQQLGWHPGTELLTGETPREFAEAIASVYTDPALWQRLRDAALARVAQEHSPDVFRTALRQVLNRAVPQAATRQTPHANVARNIRGATG